MEDDYGAESILMSHLQLYNSEIINTLTYIESMHMTEHEHEHDCSDKHHDITHITLTC